VHAEMIRLHDHGEPVGIHPRYKYVRQLDDGLFRSAAAS
jgi:hypothetical protein